MHCRHAGLAWLTPNEKHLGALPPMVLAVEDGVFGTVGCGRCIEVCPQGAISLRGATFVGCGAQVCPAAARG